MAAGAECPAVRGRVRRKRESDEGRYPGSVHVHERRGAYTVLLQSCFSHMCMVSLCLLLSPVHRKLLLACLVRLRQGPKVSKRLVRPRIKKKKQKPPNPNHILLPADRAVSVEIRL